MKRTLTIFGGIIAIVLLLAFAVLIVGDLLVSGMRDRFFSLNMEKLDSWVKNGGSTNTLTEDLVSPCSNLVLSQAGTLERL